MSRYAKILAALRSVPSPGPGSPNAEWAAFDRKRREAVAAVDEAAGRKYWRVANGMNEGDLGVFADRLSRTR